MIYRLPEIINKKSIYYQILPDLTKQYWYLKRGENTAVSLVQTGRIDSNALPLFAGMLNLLQNKSGNPVYLELTYNPRFLAYLDSINFFRELSKYGIIEYNEDYIGGLSDYNYNKENRISSYIPIKDYEDKTEEEKQEIRDILADKMRREFSASYMFRTETTPIKNDELWDMTLITVAELIVNAIIYSDSISYSYMQSGIAFTKRRKGYLLSVVDVGMGFYASLGKKIEQKRGYTQKERSEFYQYALRLGIDIKEELNFLSIMEALRYSQKQPRDINLYGLKNLLAISHANFRIHQRNREVVFTFDSCGSCMNKDILHCLECIWRRREGKKSPLKVYPVAMAGVHIEVEFIQEK